MAKCFFLTPAEADEALRAIEEVIKLSDGIMEEFGETMKTLGTCWEGETYYAYLAAYNRYKETVLAQFNLLMQAYQTAYNEARQAMMGVAPMPPISPIHLGDFDF